MNFTKFLSFTSMLVVIAGCSAPQHGSRRANGQTIFETGRDLAGTPISAKPHPLYPSCAACHGTAGAGGVHLPGGAVSADLRHAALVTRQKHPYTIPLLMRAIAKGLDNEGQPLNPVMPHWRMNARDLSDVAHYVATLR